MIGKDQQRNRSGKPQTKRYKTIIVFETDKVFTRKRAHHRTEEGDGCPNNQRQSVNAEYSIPIPLRCMGIVECYSSNTQKEQKP